MLMWAFAPRSNMAAVACRRLHYHGTIAPNMSMNEVSWNAMTYASF
jgi:hypothetical protein